MMKTKKRMTTKTKTKMMTTTTASITVRSIAAANNRFPRTKNKSPRG
ncbi:hypothetical protein [Brevibacillus brevis]|nr:hypothetical protein [Brevibacillus brevis]